VRGVKVGGTLGRREYCECRSSELGGNCMLGRRKMEEER